MKKILSLILKNIGELGIFILLLSANTTSAWISHQPHVPKDISKYKRK
ncbi:cyclic lactone autoinducer peptide [Clostridium gasigenes]|nr:cyclic lactone autoinducer peptide [Clostridium gasigenes]MBU3134293.1 cyclic lactone autoinducer peptide [Clostridium gasigenes]